MKGDSAPSVDNLACCATPSFCPLLFDLGEDLRVLEEVELLLGQLYAALAKPVQLTSSPTLIELPPQPGSRTRSPTLTLTGVTTPSLLGAPGPTAMTVASGRGFAVAEEGRKMPVAVFCRQWGKGQRRPTVSALNRWTRTRSRRGWRDRMLLKVADCTGQRYCY